MLVTSRYKEPAIREKCAALGVRLIPKGLAGFVPIQLQAPVTGHQSPVNTVETNNGVDSTGDRLPATGDPVHPPDAVLIDDDPDIRFVWGLEAKAVGKLSQTYAMSDAFLAVAAQIAKTTPIYVDVDLGNGTKGEDVAKTLHAAGFTQLYLATGYSAKDFAHVTWVQGILGKLPPWARVG